MNNLYHKVAVASVCTALGFALGANEEAYSATFSNDRHPYPRVTFHVMDGGSYGNFDGLGDTVTNVVYGSDPEGGVPHSWNMIERTAVSEKAALLEYSMSFIARVINGYRPNARITSITHAVLSIEVLNWPSYESQDDSRVLGMFGYVGNGTAEASDLEAGVFLDSTSITKWGVQYANFNVTPFLSELVSNNHEFAGFALRSLKQNGISLWPETRYKGPVWLTISGEFEIVEPEPVPEPTTIFGSAIALGVGGWLKRKNSSQKNKTTSQS